MKILRCMKFATEWPFSAFGEERFALLEESRKTGASSRIELHFLLDGLIDPVDVCALMRIPLKISVAYRI